MQKTKFLILFNIFWASLAIAQQVPNDVEYNYSITAPAGANVYVGAKSYSGYNYRPFTEEKAKTSTIADGKVTYYYNLSGEHAYCVSQANKLTQVGTFKPTATNASLEITEEQLTSKKPTDTDRNPSSNNGYNVADVFLNINAKGHLLLDKDDTHQLVHLRNWTMVKDVIANYFLEPDYHYSVINENGEPDNSVVTVNEQGLLTAVGEGTAIVLVTYDAVNAHYAAGGPFFSALWAENTGVFVVSVGKSAGNINSGMQINASRNTDESNKMATTAVDAELDVFYYLGENEGFDYTFTPSGATSVLLAHPVITENKLTYDEFSNKNVIANEDGSYTIRLVNGRNIVKLTSAEGESYQVLTAKAVNYTLENLTNPDEELNPGDEISITFNTLYHPCGKLAGIYNMSAAIQYNNIEVSMSPYGGIGQYKFASGAQTYKITIPDDFDGTEFTLTNGVIKTYGYGSPYGAHRSITLETGADPNLNTSLRTAYFGALPQITIPMKGSASQEPAIKKVEFTNENINAGIVKTEVENAEVAIGDKWIAVLAKSVKTLEAIDGNGPFHAMSFYQNMTLQAIEGGEGVTNIGKNSFNYCSNITSFSFPELENIGESAFLACGNLTEINFPKITTIDQTAFAYCNKLQTITLGSNLSESTDIIFGKEVFSSVKTENVDLVLGANVEVDGEDCDIANNIYKGYTFKSISGGKPAIIDIATAVVAPILDQIHTGSSIEPTLTLTIGDTELNEGEDYELIYSNNIAVGIATISIRGIGNYSGTQSVEFTIIAQSTTAIDTVDANSATIVGYCNLMGQSISKAPERGIYIILYSNGTSQKNVKQ